MWCFAMPRSPAANSMQSVMHLATPQDSAIKATLSLHEGAPNIRAAIVGRGAISRHYLAALREQSGFDLVAVCDRDERQLESPRKSGLHVVADFRDLLRLSE